MDWINDPRLWVAATPLCVFIGASVAFYIATEQGDTEDVPRVKRGDSEYEPWWAPVVIKKYRLPGDSVIRTRRVPIDETAHLARIEDERMKADA